MYGYGFGSKGSGSGTGQLGRQNFTATAGQTVFTCTTIILNDGYTVFVGGVLQSFGHSRSGNIVTFTSGQDEGTEVIIIN